MTKRATYQRIALALVLVAGAGVLSACGLFRRPAPVVPATPAASRSVQLSPSQELAAKLAALDQLERTEIKPRELQRQTLLDLINALRQAITVAVRTSGASAQALPSMAAKESAAVTLEGELGLIEGKLVSLYDQRDQLVTDIAAARDVLEDADVNGLPDEVKEQLKAVLGETALPAPVPGGPAQPGAGVAVAVPTAATGGRSGVSAPASGSPTSGASAGAVPQPTATPAQDYPQAPPGWYDPTPTPSNGSGGTPPVFNAPGPVPTVTATPTVPAVATPTPVPGGPDATPTATPPGTPATGTATPAPTPSATGTPAAGTATPAPAPAPGTTPTPLPTPPGAVPAQFGENLLLNSGAEAGPGAESMGEVVPVWYWSSTGTLTVVKYGSAGFPDAASSGADGPGVNFIAGGPIGISGTAGASQRLYLSALAAEIDAGEAAFDLSAFLGGWLNSPDVAGVLITFVDAYGQVLFVDSLGPVTAQDRSNATGMVLRTTTGPVPPGTRRVDVDLRMEGGDGYIDAYADNITFVLSQVAP